LSTKPLRRLTSELLLLIPLAFSAFTHLWNPIGFPSIYVDEGHYMRRSLQVLEWSGHQEPSSAFTGYHPYDHPYLGQILLGFILKMVGYPSSLDPAAVEVSSIQMLHMVPRIFMGFLAVIDTFLVYKISSLRYNKKVALAAAILFAVMPMTWLVRRILLESILLPLILSSVFFAVHHYNITKNKNGKQNQEMLAVLLSGIFLGLAIFTKIPAFTMLPLIGYFVFTSTNNKKWMRLGVWFIPVVLIPAIWPAYAMLYGQFEQWVDGILWQTSRVPRSLLDSLKSVFEIDPILVTLGILGVVWTTIRRDYFLLLWVMPYSFFLGIVGYSQYIHMVLLLPLFSIATAILILDFSNKLRPVVISVSIEFTRILTRLKSMREIRPEYHQSDISAFFGGEDVTPTPSGATQSTSKKGPKVIGFLSSFPLFLFILAVVTIFGLFNTTILITTNVNDSLFEAYAAYVAYLFSENNSNKEEPITLTSSVKWGTYFYWIPKYVFDKELVFLDERSLEVPSTDKVTTIGGKRDNGMDEEFSVLVGRMNNTARDFNYEQYPYNSMKYNELGNLDVNGNY
jgi:hypothetical protein